jgi:uncharacterized membrane protein
MGYDEKKYKLHNLYLEQLDKTMKQYPPYKVGEANTYTRELSLLNGISKQIDDLHNEIKESLSSVSRMIQRSDTAIRQIETIETNLSNYTNAEALDMTSKQMLADAEQEYNREKTLFFIKLAVVIFIMIHLIRQKKYIIVVVFVILALIFAFVSNFLVKMNER